MAAGRFACQGRISILLRCRDADQRVSRIIIQELTVEQEEKGPEPASQHRWNRTDRGASATRRGVAKTASYAPDPRLASPYSDRNRRRDRLPGAMDAPIRASGIFVDKTLDARREVRRGRRMRDLSRARECPLARLASPTGYATGIKFYGPG